VPSARTTNVGQLGRVPYTRHPRPFPKGTTSVIEALLAEPVVQEIQCRARNRSRKYDQASLSPVKNGHIFQSIRDIFGHKFTAAHRLTRSRQRESGMVQLRVTAIPEVAIRWSSAFSRLTDRPKGGNQTPDH